jgi:DNA-binding transcriptional ArsR family regulator
MSSAGIERPPASGWVKNLGPDPRDLRIEVDWGLAYELVLGLRMLVGNEDPASYSVGASWFRRVRRAAPAELLASIDRLCGGHEIIFGQLLGLASEAPPPRDVAALLRQLRRTTPLSLRLHLLGSSVQTSRGGVSRQVVGKAARGDAPAIERLLRGTDPDRRPAIEHILALDTREAKRLLIQIVRGWNAAVLSPIADETGPTLRRAAERTRAMAERAPSGRVIEAAARGFQYAREPGIDRVLLVPSAVGRPWAVLCEHRSTKIICYAVDDPSDRTLGEPPGGVIRFHKALSDVTRLRLLRRLATDRCTVQELADGFGLAKSTVHAHLVLLRGAGLVRWGITDKRYELRDESLGEGLSALESYMREEGA